VSKDGRITNIKVLSGDAMLTNAATDAVRQWQYRPYLLNGQPLEVETQITVSFKLPK
jgi:protein TonB